MNEKPQRRNWIGWKGTLMLLAFILVLVIGTMREANFWSSADQRGDTLFLRGKFEEAAKTYADPMRQGIAFYRGGDFEQAARAFIRVPGAAGAFNQGDALLMHGAYDQAIAAFDRALSFQPGWKEAEENRALAVTRRNLLKKEHGDEGADQEADQIVVDLNAKNVARKSDNPELGDKLTDAELQATWLRRVQTTPGDFLRIKFSYQAQMKAGIEQNEERDADKNQ